MKQIEILHLEAEKWISKNLHREDVSSIKLLKGGERVQQTLSVLREARLLDNVKFRSKDAGRAEQLRQRGNEFYKLKKIPEALNFYTNSLFTAPPDSPEYYLALSNRSAVLLYLDHFLAIEDAELALSLMKDKRPDLTEKLKNRIEKCRMISRNITQTIKKTAICQYFEIKDKRNLKIPCASENITLDCDEQCGRKLVAAVDMDPGHVIVIEGPYTQVVEPKKLFSRCAYCLSQNVALKPCPGCVDTGFCSDKCRSLAKWHKYECPIADRLAEMKFTIIELLSLRITCQAKCDFPDWKELQNVCNAEESQLQDLDKIIDNTYSSAHRLETNENIRSHDDLFGRCVTAAVFLFLLKSETTFFDDWKEAEAEKLVALLLSHHMMTVPTNAHALSELYIDDCGDFSDSDRFGSGLYPFLSMFNHSCCPNVVVQDIGIVKVAIILRYVKKGDQLFDNYGPHHAMVSKEDRQSQLQKQYKFSCKCEACSNDWPTYGMLPQVPAKINFDIENWRCFDLFLKGNIEKALEILPLLYSDAKILESFGPSFQVATIQEFIKQGLSILALNMKPEDLN